MSVTLRIDARRYEDDDNSLATAAADIASQRGLYGWDLCARWEDEQRDTILLDVPPWAARPEDDLAVKQ